MWMNHLKSEVSPGCCKLLTAMARRLQVAGIGTPTMSLEISNLLGGGAALIRESCRYFRCSVATSCRLLSRSTAQPETLAARPLSECSKAWGGALPF